MPNKNADLINSLDRTLRIIRDLDRAGGVGKDELSKRYGVSKRTIERTINVIEAAGLPLVRELREGKAFYRIAYADKLARLSSLVDASHYLALRVAMGQGGPSRTLPMQFVALEDLADKIETALGPQGRQQLQVIDNCFYSYEKGRYHNAPIDLMWPLVQAIGERRLCDITYTSARVDAKPTVYRILPLKLFVHDAALYLLAQVPKYDEVRTFNLQRIVELRLREEKGRPPAGFDMQQWERKAFRLVTGVPDLTYRLRFSPAIAVYIREREWHPGQVLTELGDGGVELSFTCGESYEVTSWIASWRGGVEVLQPKKLRREMRQLGQQLAELYKD